MMFVSWQGKVGDYPVNVFCIGLLFVVTVLIRYIEDDVYATEGSKSQPENVDEAVTFVPG